LLLEIGDSMGIIPGTTICGLSDGAAWPIKNAIRKFRDEFEEYLKLKEKEVELLKTVPPKLYPYYKKEVNEYFKRIGTQE
jgi:hypothetical protein